MSRLDPEDIKNAAGERDRELKRKRVIKSFLWWAQGEKQRWNSQNNEERIVVKRQFAYGRMLTLFGLFTNFAVYNCFFTGIYNFRQTELLDMRRVPFIGKFALSSMVAYYMCSKLWENNIYESELYEVALKYRDRYDKSLMPSINQQSSNSNIEEQSSVNTSENNKNLQIA